MPGYRAPEDTVLPGARVPVALLKLAGEAWAAGALVPATEPLAPELAEQAKAVAEFGGQDLPAAQTARGAMIWTQLFGIVGFEIFGQLANSMDPADAFFDYAVERMADLLGLAAEGGKRPV